jgi:hypothetical protein
MFEADGETLRLVRLMRLRDSLLDQILYGLRHAQDSQDLDLIRELELKTEEAKMVSHEISQLMKNGETHGTATNA